MKHLIFIQLFLKKYKELIVAQKLPPGFIVRHQIIKTYILFVQCDFGLRDKIHGCCKEAVLLINEEVGILH